MRRVRRRDRDVAAGKRSDQGGGDGGVLITVIRVHSGVIGVVTIKGALDQILYFRPIVRECRREILLGRCRKMLAVGGGEFLKPNESARVSQRASLIGSVVLRGLRSVDRVREAGRSLDVHAEGDTVINLIPEVLTYAREIRENWDILTFQCLSRADAGEHEELRGLKCSGGKDNFAAGMEGIGQSGGLDGNTGGGVVRVEEDLSG